MATVEAMLMDMKKEQDRQGRVQKGLLTSVSDLAVITKEISDHVYEEEVEEEEGFPLENAPDDEDEFPMLEELEDIESEDKGMHSKGMHNKGGMRKTSHEDEDMEKMGRHKADEEILEDEEILAEDMIEEEDEELALAKFKAARALRFYRKARISKGYSSEAKRKKNADDSPFDTQQNSMGGNTPQPAGEMTGNREDETFNAAFARIDSVERENAQLRKQVESMRTAKAISPALGGIRKSQRDRGQQSGGLTRDVQAAVKDRSWRELNQLRIQVGDLSAHGF